MYLFENFLFINEITLLLFAVFGFILIIGVVTKKDKWIKTGTVGLAISGPLSLAFCWVTLDEVRDNNTIIWSRLMAGDSSFPFSMGTLALIVAIGAAVFCLTLIMNPDGKKGALYLAFLFFAGIWFIRLAHPTPYYVPMPDWLDKLVWLLIILGEIGLCIILIKFVKALPSFLKKILMVFTGFIAIAMPFPLISYSHYKSNSIIDFQPLSAEKRIKIPGCLACHTAKGKGHKFPGGGLESIQSKTRETIFAFLKEPTRAKAKELKIRDNPTGEMAGVHLSESDARLLTSALFEYLGVSPTLPPIDGNAVKSIIEKNKCLSCHSLAGHGAPKGGIGGPFERAAKLYTEESLRAWLENPSSDNAIKLGISKEPYGIMSNIKLSKEEIVTIVRFIISQKQ